jgi:hypothetical protein
VPQLPDFKPFKDARVWTTADIGGLLRTDGTLYVQLPYSRRAAPCVGALRFTLCRFRCIV